MYFIGFINFWNVCSLYALIQTEMPTYLKDVLLKIYEMVNFSIFNLINISFDFNFGIKDFL
jgi:hypothetical protein